MFHFLTDFRQSFFQRHSHGAAGRFDVDGVQFERPQVITPLDESYRLRDSIDPRVFLLKLVPGTSPDVLRFVKDAGYRGLVIEAFGLGGLHYIRRNLVRAMEELGESGIRVLVVSQCLYERANLNVYEVGRGLMKDYILNGHDMTTEAAVCKMMWALGQEDPGAFLKHRFVGEYRLDETY